MTKTKKTITKSNEEVVKMTQEAYDELKLELQHRVEALRPEIADEIASARELGDLSENHAYTVAMEKKEMNENRINELEGILAVVQIANESTSDNVVNIGEFVEIQDIETKKKKVVELVGSEESKSANPAEGKISVNSPIGKALYRALIGDVVEVVLPTKSVKYKIVKFVK